MKAILVEWRVMREEKLQVIAQTDEYLIVEKPHGLPTVPLKRAPEGDSLLTAVSRSFPEVLGETHEGYTLHRLDTATRGVVMFARTSESFTYYSAQQKSERILKEYLALCTFSLAGEGYPPFPHPLCEGETTVITSRFRPWGKGRKEVRPVTDLSHTASRMKGGTREYTTEVLMSRVDSEVVSFQAKLTNGFRHQVRSHLAWAGYPIIGDTQYGGAAHDELQLYALSLTLYDRVKEQYMSYALEDIDSIRSQL